MNALDLIALLLSSTLTFTITAAFVTWATKWIHDYRTRATFRLIPLVCLCLDFMYNKHSPSHWINPLSCDSCVQKFFLTNFFPGLKETLIEQKISLIRYMGNDVQYEVVWQLIAVAMLVAAFFALYRLYQVHCFAKHIQKATASVPIIHAQALANALKRYNVTLNVSDAVEIPVAIYPNCIAIPSNTTSLLSSDEFEAVVAHELEHLKYRDPLTRLFAHITRMLFWWVGISSWLQKIEQDQEMACDNSVTRYGIQKESLATSLVKIAKEVHRAKMFCHLSKHPNLTKERLEVLLEQSSPKQKKEYDCLLYAVGALVALQIICQAFL